MAAVNAAFFARMVDVINLPDQAAGWKFYGGTLVNCRKVLISKGEDND